MSVSSTVLRPLSLGELLDRAIRLYRKNFAKFIGILAVVQIPLSLLGLLINLFTFSDTAAIAADPSAIQAADPFSLFTPAYFIGIGLSLLLLVITLILVQGIATAALTRLISDTYFGEQYGMLDAYKKIGKSSGALIGTYMLYAFYTFLLLILLIIPCIGWLAAPGALATLSYMVLPLVAPVIVLERYRGRKALRRAWELVRKRFWWVAGFMFILSIFGLVLVGIPNGLITYLMQITIADTIQDARTLYTIQTVLQSISATLFNLLYLPLQLACFTLLYFDLRVRQDGLDLAIQAEEGGESGVPLSDLIARDTAVPQGGLLTWQEFGYFCLFSTVVVGLYFVLVFILLAAASALTGF